MGKLTRSPARLGFSAPRSTAPRQVNAPPPAQTSKPWKAWYNTARWRSLRAEVLTRDAYTCAACRRVLGGKSPEPDSPVVDHIRPHRGDERLFWLKTNLQTLCKSPCHDQHKQALEQDSRHHAGVWD